MNNSIFGRVFRYRQSDNRSPTEDFFTEVFVGTLESSDLLSKAFVGHLLDTDVDSVRFETQKTVDQGILDVWVDAHDRDGRHVIAFENKIGAMEGHGQLHKYERYLGIQNAKTKRLYYLTLHSPTNFEPQVDGVEFRRMQWFEVYNWIKAWLPGHEQAIGQRSRVLVNEMLALMEEWNMATNLNVSDFAAATVYKTRVHGQLVHLMNVVFEKTGIPSTKSNQWSYDYAQMTYDSAWIDDKRDGVYLSYGFEFHRDDRYWSSTKLLLPAAYFGITGPGVGECDLSGLSERWTDPPDTWQWASGSRVVQITSLPIHGVDVGGKYLGFFLGCKGELWRVMERRVGSVPMDSNQTY